MVCRAKTGEKQGSAVEWGAGWDPDEVLEVFVEVMQDNGQTPLLRVAPGLLFPISYMNPATPIAAFAYAHLIGVRIVGDLQTLSFRLQSSGEIAHVAWDAVDREVARRHLHHFVGHLVWGTPWPIYTVFGMMGGALW